MSLLWSHPHVRISTSLLDSHVYLFNLNHLLDLLRSQSGQKMKSLREEVVPFMVKCSWMAGLREKAGWTSRASKSSPLQDQASYQLGKDVAAATALRSTTYVDSQLLQSGSSYRPAIDDIEDRPSLSSLQRVPAPSRPPASLKTTTRPSVSPARHRQQLESRPQRSRSTLLSSVSQQTASIPSIPPPPSRRSESVTKAPSASPLSHEPTPSRLTSSATDT